MQFSYEINPKFQDCEEFILSIKEQFEKEHETIHKARNILKIIPYQNLQIVVKNFKVPHIINRFAYTYIRKSKAYKSFHNAMKLKSLEVDTPEPVGYIHFFENSFLKESFYLSLYEPYEYMIREVLENRSFTKRETLLEEFAINTYRLHKKNIWHSDYSPGNILVKSGGGYRFSLVDINRMKFRSVESYEGLENFNKLWANKEDLTIMAKAYASVAKLDEKRAISEIVAHDRANKRVKNFKKWLKGEPIG